MRQKAVPDDIDPGYVTNVTRVRASPFYRNALARAEQCPELVAELGEPLEADLPKGSIKSLCEGTPTERAVTEKYLTTMIKMMRAGNLMADTDQFSHVSVVLRGPNGHGTLIMFASGVGDSWTFHRLDVAMDGREDRIPLLHTDA